MLKEDAGHEYTKRMVQEEVKKYKAGLERGFCCTATIFSISRFFQDKCFVTDAMSELQTKVPLKKRLLFAGKLFDPSFAEL